MCRCDPMDFKGWWQILLQLLHVFISFLTQINENDEECFMHESLAPFSTKSKFMICKLSCSYLLKKLLYFHIGFQMFLIPNTYCSFHLSLWDIYKVESVMFPAGFIYFSTSSNRIRFNLHRLPVPGYFLLYFPFYTEEQSTLVKN